MADTKICGIDIAQGTPVQVCVADGTFAECGLIEESCLTMATARLLGRTTAAAGAIEDIAMGDTSLILSTGTLAMFAAKTVVDNDTGLTQALTNSATAVTGSGITVDLAGTYLISAYLTLAFNAATFAASRTITIAIARSNNTPGDLTNGTVTLRTLIVTTLTQPETPITIPPFLYTTANADDALVINVSINTVPSAGSVTVTEARIRATRIR